MFQKSLFQKLRQVVLTYLTWRWMWLVMSLTVFLTLGTAWKSSSFQNHPGEQFISAFFSGIFGIGLPIAICMQWFISVAKWQFADPRARLLPGYMRPHFVVIFAVLVLFLLVNPLLQTYWKDISPLGPLAFSLLIGGPFLWSAHYSQGALAFPTVVVLFSGMHPATSHFWFAENSNYLAIHAAMIIVGAALTAGWLWKLATLHEEDEGYFVTPLGGAAGSLSRLERVLQGRHQGRKTASGGFGYGFSDRWHNRLLRISKNSTPAKLSTYGWGRFSHSQQAIVVGLGIVLYGLFIGYIAQWQGKTLAGIENALVYAASFVLPSLGAAMSLRSRRVRMASELLRPANRTKFIAGLFRSLTKQTLVFWLTMSAGSCVVLMTSLKTLVQGDLTQLAMGFLLLSLVVQLPALAIGLRMALWRSPVLFGFGCYVLGHLEIGLFVGWVALQEDYGPIPTALLAALVLTALGLPLRTWARNAWLRAELA